MRLFSLQFIAVAKSTRATMFPRATYRGGRNQWPRRFSDHPIGERDQFVTGDSHFQSVRDANLGFRQGHNGNFVNRGGFQYPRPQSPMFHKPKPQDYRNWEFAAQKPAPNFEQFAVLSYNILAEYLANDHRHKLYYHIPRHMLAWEWRKKNIIFELGLWSADIMCFQEVDRFQDLEEELRLRGYNGIWKMRTGDPIDGCAIFWRASRFKLLHEEFIEFNKLGLRDNVAQICVLESLSKNCAGNVSAHSTSSTGSNKVVICNIHVLYNPRRGDIKLAQVRVLLNKAHAISKIWNDAPVVICGDFNCTPKSPLYNFISEQQLDLSGLASDKVSGQASAEIHAPSQYTTNPGAHSGNIPTMNNFSQSEATSSTSLTEAVNHSQSNEIQGVTSSIASIHEDTYSDEIETDHGGKLNADSRERSRSTVSVEEESLNYEKTTVFFVGDDSLDNEEKNDNFTLDQESVSHTSTTIELDERLGNLSLNELDEVTKKDENLGEDCNTFLSKLHNNEITISSEVGQFVQSDQVESDNSHFKYSAYDPSVWIEIATGFADCTFMEHPLKLRSTYAEVEDHSGTRDLDGEPLATSYNRIFFGTVDYIWCSEGLQTVKVLAPIPKHAMQWTPGFPTRKWGSDHIALVSHLAFVKALPIQEPEVQ